MRLYLAITRQADAVGQAQIAYHFLCKAFEKYEETANSKAQFDALSLIIGAVHECRSFAPDDYEALSKKVAKYADRMVRREDSC